MKITLYISEDCQSCQTAISSINQLNKNNYSIILEIKDLAENPYDFQIIVPSLFIDDELVLIGEFSPEKLHSIFESRQILSE